MLNYNKKKNSPVEVNFPRQEEWWIISETQKKYVLIKDLKTAKNYSHIFATLISYEKIIIKIKNKIPFYLKIPFPIYTHFFNSSIFKTQ